MSEPNITEVEGRVDLTAEAHRRLAEVVGAGDWVVDATVGNGHDTLFLARQVGASGVLHGFDIQPQALAAARERLAAAALEPQVVLHLLGHERMAETLGSEARLKAVCFNLGYLPGGDKGVITQCGTTLAALDQALQLLQPSGLLTVILYPGHRGGGEESEAVRGWFETQSAAGHEVEALRIKGCRERCPELWTLRP